MDSNPYRSPASSAAPPRPRHAHRAPWLSALSLEACFWCCLVLLANLLITYAPSGLPVFSAVAFLSSTAAVLSVSLYVYSRWRSR